MVVATPGAFGQIGRELSKTPGFPVIRRKSHAECRAASGKCELPKHLKRTKVTIPPSSLGKLRVLSLHDTQASDQGIARLRKKLPDLDVSR